MHIGLVVAKIVVAILGLLIAFQSYRAYARYDSSPMLYLALGFSLISIGSVIEGVLYEVVKLSLFYAGMVQSIVVALGMVAVLYSLYGRER
ncbi:DUF7521 family protein [Haladaptatus cibarius]|uniref:DUF7521 family protein n=1 Tax=Haladaptatus TaxID=367188 RepID=UPI0006785E76|nr:hypothetical protein [Haladaptatus cibarius]